MTHKDFDKLFKKMIDEEVKVMCSKGPDYTRNSPDKLANFKRTANEIGITPEKVLYVLIKKHWAAIITYIKEGKLKGEPVESKILDVRNYLALLRALIEERRK
ncbi:MAG: hypothetical protein ACFFAU_01000 [Candidatus Hodarchaeota archaeon]